jgi:hypothetical protein
MHIELTPSELEQVTGGISGKKQPTQPVGGSKSISKPLQAEQGGPQPLPGGLPQISPAPPPPRIVAEPVGGH